MKRKSAWLPRIPLTLNELIRRHWRDRTKDSATWSVVVLTGLGRPPPTWTPHRVRVAVTVHRGGSQDPDNAVGSVKPLIDALVRAGWLEDDTTRHVELIVREVRQRKAAERGTMVELEALD